MKHSIVIHNKGIQHFSLWDGEIGVTVFRHAGLHGFYDAALIVRSPDSPMETYQYNVGYENEDANRGSDDERRQLMDEWIRKQILTLASNSAGDTCEIVPGEKGFLFG